MIDASFVWAPAVVTVSALGYRVAVRWLDTRERTAVAAEQRNEREQGVMARMDTCESQMKALGIRVETWIANNGQRR